MGLLRFLMSFVPIEPRTFGDFMREVKLGACTRVTISPYLKVSSANLSGSYIEIATGLECRAWTAAGRQIKGVFDSEREEGRRGASETDILEVEMQRAIERQAERRRRILRERMPELCVRVDSIALKF